MSQGGASRLNVVTDVSKFLKEHPNCPHSVLFFWTSWHSPCSQLAPVLTELSNEHKHVAFYSIDAEAYSDIATTYQVEAVPTIIFCENGIEKQRFEAVLAPILVSHLTKFSTQALNVQKLHSVGVNKQVTEEKANNEKNTKFPEISGTEKEETIEELNARIEKLIHSNAMMLFIKGSPANPKCKFTRAILELLKKQGIVSFGYFDIWQDPKIKEQIKVYSDWATFPQLYINGKLIGGVDVVRDMIEEGEFEPLIPPQCKKQEESLNDRLKRLIASKPAMLFMKGSPDDPKCGFSEQIVALLNEQGLEFGYFDILTDKTVREGLKKYSDWHTYPQLYIKGKLIGGVDVVKELIDENEFENTVLAPLRSDAIPNTQQGDLKKKENNS